MRDNFINMFYCTKYCRVCVTVEWTSFATHYVVNKKKQVYT